MLKPVLYFYLLVWTQFCHIERDFNRHVESYPGWTAKQVVATPEEMKFFGHRSGNKYFTRILYTIPDLVEEEK